MHWMKIFLLKIVYQFLFVLKTFTKHSLTFYLEEPNFFLSNMYLICDNGV